MHYILALEYRILYKINLYLHICLEVLTTGLQDTAQNKPVFDPEIHTELIIKDEFNDLKTDMSKYLNYFTCFL